MVSQRTASDLHGLCGSCHQTKDAVKQCLQQPQVSNTLSMRRPTPSMAGSSKNTALELERVYTPRSVAAIQAALSTLHDKLEAGHTQANQLAVHPMIALQNKGNQQTENCLMPFCVSTACNVGCAGRLLVDDSMCTFALQNAVHSLLALGFKLHLHPLLSQCWCV